MKSGQLCQKNAQQFEIPWFEQFKPNKHSTNNDGTYRTSSQAVSNPAILYRSPTPTANRKKTSTRKQKGNNCKGSSPLFDSSPRVQLVRKWILQAVGETGTKLRYSFATLCEI